MATHLQRLSDKIITLQQAQKEVVRWKFLGQKIVFTNGCFDLLHEGHITYLSQAADKGDRLIIGLNSDESVKSLEKGDSRPINSEQSRAKLLAAIHFVDVVTIFSEETPLSLIESINPDVLVKGGDWDISKIVGANHVKSYGGSVESIPLVSGFSTTSIEEKIKHFS